MLDQCPGFPFVQVDGVFGILVLGGTSDLDLHARADRIPGCKVHGIPNVAVAEVKTCQRIDRAASTKLVVDLGLFCLPAAKVLRNRPKCLVFLDIAVAVPEQPLFQRECFLPVFLPQRVLTAPSHEVNFRVRVEALVHHGAEEVGCVVLLKHVNNPAKVDIGHIAGSPCFSLSSTQ